MDNVKKNRKDVAELRNRSKNGVVVTSKEFEKALKSESRAKVRLDEFNKGEEDGPGITVPLAQAPDTGGGQVQTQEEKDGS